MALTPTIGLDMEQVVCSNMYITCWDVGGGNSIRPLYRHYYAGISALIFVVDCSDRECIERSKGQLELLLCEPLLQNRPLLVFANKQDVPNAMSASDLADQLRLKDAVVAPWHVQPCSARRGEGLLQGLEWIEAVL
jgi:signal recognition particle receptor subunit beta